ncbi:uncharacterized protein LOC134679240 [Cydia fagiglandana]|uniref:uncharacterized protein LOC134679240 n=1 Tax=Cydia fagiglandana TaxID=1458189 RepID=UPI002FEE3D14
MEIEALTEKPDEAYAEREQFESQFFVLVSTARLLLTPTVQSSGGRPGPGSAASTSSGAGRQDFVRLPKIDLPHFDGNYQHWLGFRDTYISLIHNNPAINDISKFHYLRASLKSSAALVIQSLDFSSDNYYKAWQLVSERYDNPRLLINNHIQALFNLEPMQHESSSLLRNMVDVTNKNLRALGTLGEPTDHWDTLVIYIMSKMLDLVTKREWEEHRNLLTGSPTLQQYIKFLNNRADLLESLGNNNVNNSGYKTSKHKLHSHNEPQKTHNYLTATKNNAYRKPIVCPYCKQDHFLFNCESFRKLDIDNRIKNVNGYSVCKNCLRPGHLEKQCVLSHCKYCKLKHNTLLHKHVDKESSSSDVPVPDVHFSGNIQTKVFSPTKTSGLLSTALVHVSDANGVLREARLLLYNGSATNFVTQDLCGQLGLATRSVGATITGINEQLSHCPESCDITIHSLHSNYTTTVNCYVANVINTSMPPCRIDLTNIPIPADITLADPSFYEPSAIDILVGAEIFWDVLGTARIKLGKNKPQLRESSLGWLVCGSIPAYNKNTNESYFCSFITHNDDTNLTRFWELDSVSSTHCMSYEEQACEKSFLENTIRDQDGRFVVTLPLKESPEVLGDSYQMAQLRFLALEKRLARDAAFKTLYFDFIREYIDLGHMSENQSSSSSSAPSEKAFFFPHHGILRSSTTTRLRVVYDGSASTTSGKSFNDIQMVGPTVQDDLLSILLRFRQHNQGSSLGTCHKSNDRVVPCCSPPLHESSGKASNSVLRQWDFQKTKWHTSTDQLQVGTMVLVKDRALPPLLWLLGRVTKLYPGTDNVTRVADIHTKKGVILVTVAAVAIGVIGVDAAVLYATAGAVEVDGDAVFGDGVNVNAEKLRIVSCSEKAVGRESETLSLIEELSGTRAFNNISYADDMVLLSPSVCALKTLLKICESYAVVHGLMYNADKTELLIFKAGTKTYNIVPPIELGGVQFKLVTQFKYLGHWVTASQNDDLDLERKRRALLISENLWVNYTKKAFSALRVLYNNSFRMLMGLPRYCSASGMFEGARTDDFHSIMRKRVASLMRCVRGSANTM